MPEIYNTYKHDTKPEGSKVLYRTDVKSVYGRSEAPIKLFIESRVEAYKEKSIYDKIYNMETTKNAIDKFTGMTAMKGFSVVAEGGEYINDEYGYQETPYSSVFESVTWRDQFVITQEMVEDSKMINFKNKPAAFVDGYNRTREQFGAGLLSAAINHANKTADLDKVTVSLFGDTFSFACCDGKALFAKDHPGITTKGGTPQTNNFSMKFKDSDTTQILTPDVFDALESKMQNFRDDNGNVLNICPDTIIIPNIPRTKRRVFEIIGAEKSPYTANNGHNFQFGRWNIIVWQYLNQFVDSNIYKDQDFMIMMDSSYNSEYKGAVWMDRVPLQVKSDVDIRTDNCIWKGRARFTAGFHDWRAFAVAGISNGSLLV